ncbi:MAG TPA: serine hydrolase domain-containing protein [Gemmatimonadaceae bacterium]|nr:serine hydrolase domain-containing protein [Gemmatimonadaceae bacterium]
MNPRVLPGALLLASTAVLAQSPPAIPRAELAAFVDSVIRAEMSREHIPGAAFAFVQHGRVVYMKGFGTANVARNTRVVPESTIWRIGSISKLFTATAAMQLVDRGLVDLDAPIDRYVKRVQIPATYPAPVTLRHLLTHTAGFDEIRPGTQAATRDGVLPLDQFLATRLVRLRAPGHTIAYSTYGVTLAGELVEEVANLPFETYLQKNIWQPLGMTRSSINVPPALANDVAMGYEIAADTLVPQPWEWYHTTPASSVNATVSDMAQFMLAHLGAAKGDGRLFSQRTAREMQRQQVTMHPSMPGYAIGFNEDFAGSLRVIEHGGNVAGFSTEMLLIPEADAGFFVANQLEGSRLRDNLKWALLERFFPETHTRFPVPPLPAPDVVHAERFAGRYIPLTSCFSCTPIRASSVMPVTANPDGTLTFAGGRWIQVDSLRFVKEQGTGYIVFSADSTGAIREVNAGSYWAWHKLQTP